MQIKRIDDSFLNEIFAISKEQFKNESYSISQLKDCLNSKNYICFGVFIDMVLTSYVIALNTLDDVNILSIATKKEYQNQGLATILIEKIKKYAVDNKKTVSLEVKSKNLNAFNLYTKLKFKVISKRLNYYKDNDTALIMFYNLQQ